MEWVDAYYMPIDGGAYELYEMQRIDFNEVKANPKFSRQWSLTPPSEGATVHDKRPPKLDIAQQVEVQAAAPVSPPVSKRRQPNLTPI
jgi:hypothetical protein